MTNSNKQSKAAINLDECIDTNSHTNEKSIYYILPLKS